VGIAHADEAQEQRLCRVGGAVEAQEQRLCRVGGAVTTLISGDSFMNKRIPVPTNAELMADFVWPVGEHKGKPIADVPTEYLRSIPKPEGLAGMPYGGYEENMYWIALLEVSRRGEFDSYLALNPADRDEAERLVKSDAKYPFMAVLLSFDGRGRSEDFVSMILDIEDRAGATLGGYAYQTAEGRITSLARTLSVLRKHGITVSEV